MSEIEFRAVELGATALREGREIARLTGELGDDHRWGWHAWIEYVLGEDEDRELIRDLYARAAGPWVERGYLLHYVNVPADDEAALSAWFDLSFGKQQVYARLELAARSRPRPESFTVRLGGPDDFEGSLALGNLIREAHFGPPVWSGIAPRPLDELRAEWSDDSTDENDTSFVAVRGSDVLGELVMVRRDDEEVYLAYAAVRPDERGGGVGVALTEASLAWAYEQGFRRCVTDWRVTNMLASRFWPRRGFRPTRYRLHRMVRPLARA